MGAGAGGNIFVDLYLLVILKLFFQVKRTNTNLQKYHHPAFVEIACLPRYNYTYCPDNIYELDDDAKFI